MVLDGSESWRLSAKSDDYADFRLLLDSPLKTYDGANGICDKFKYQSNKNGSWIITDEGITVFNAEVIFSVLKSRLSTVDVNGFKTWLSQNPVTVQYPLFEKSVKTVDLTILDQNGQNVKQLISFNGGTHFNTGSSVGSPLPMVVVSVETDLEETLKRCSLEGNTL